MSEPDAAPAPAPVSVSEDRGPGPVGVALLVSGFVLAAAAQYLPWASVDMQTAAGAGDEDGPLPTSIELDLASFNNGHVIAYLATVAFALVGVGVLVATRGPVRRAAAAAALGLLAGNALVLVGLKKAVEHFGSSALVSFRLPQETIHIGAGYPLAIAATVLLAVGVVTAARMLPDTRRRRPADEPHDGAEPLELTVTPLQ
ncbi:hypothetical protein [Dactylosporangium sp. NPDC000521]|uniref:hypothetical protein n=1 Tax=Dactylosporangium sp. NPDC000521 TaxID=3363975 RepID=UPI0036C8FC55